MEPYATMHPHGMSESLTSSASQPLLIKFSNDVINQMVKAVMKLVMRKLFSEHVMTIEKTLKRTC
jgi:hypothetical protein